MKIFVSWSGFITKRVAELIRDWLPNVLQSIDPWVSSEDIEKGEIWFTSIADTISTVVIGIVCLSKDNVNAPWILFESGALSKGITKNRVCTLLIDLEPSDLKPPLSNFNATKITKEDMLKLLKTINSASGDKALPEQRLSASFERWWPDFDQKIAEILESVPATKQPPKRSLDDMTAEILDTVRAIQKSSQESKSDPLGLFSSGEKQPIVAWPPPIDSKVLDRVLREAYRVTKGAIRGAHNNPSGYITFTSNRDLTAEEDATLLGICLAYCAKSLVRVLPPVLSQPESVISPVPDKS